MALETFRPVMSASDEEFLTHIGRRLTEVTIDPPETAFLFQRVNFKLALMAYRVLNGLAPPYLNQLVPVSNLPGRRRLRSSFTLQLHVPPYRLSTAGRPPSLVSCRSIYFLEHSPR